MATSHKTLKLDLGARSYDILIGSALLPQTGALIKPVLESPRVIIVTDTNIRDLHLNSLKKSLESSNIKHDEVVVKAGEESKSFAELEKLISVILSKNIDRKITLIALGGGVIGDLTGFAASVLLRGVNFIQIPTTLLAMVDSSVGGKTGINTSHGKNLVGAFHQPKMVLIDIDLIKTLPENEFMAGYAEVVKYGLINDEEFFSWLEKNAAKIKKRDKDSLAYIVEKSCAAKAKIVGKDERETAERALLNLGHTFGHALETEANYKKILHGEAVSVGMVLAFEFSKDLGLCAQKDLERIKEHFSEIGLPQKVSDFPFLTKDAKKYVAHMRKDKKVESGKLTFILAKGIGKSFVQKDVEEEKVLKTLSRVII